MVLAGITGQWGKGHSSALQKEGMETHKRDNLCWICRTFRSLSRALIGIKVVLLGTGARVLPQGIP